MQRRTRTPVLVAIPLTLALTLTACGGGDSSAEPTADGGGGTTTELSYWLWDSLQLPAYQACADAFTEANPGITVNITQYGWDDYWTTLTTNFVSGSAPDVFTNHVLRFPEYSAQGQILDIADRVEAHGIDLGQYQHGLADLWVGQDGERYGLPKDWDTIALFYNTALVEEAGYTEQDLWDLEWNPTDGGSYEALLAHLTIDENGVRGDEDGFDKDNVEVYGLGLATAGAGFGQTENSLYTLSNNGWYYLNENPWGTEYYYSDSRYTETIAWWRSLIEKGYMPTLEIATSSDGVMDPFGAGKYAIVTEGDWNANAYNDLTGVDVAFAPTPIGPSGERASMFNGLADSIWSGTSHPDEAWAWVSYLGSTECQDVVADHAVVFPAITASSEKAAAKFEEKGMDMSAFTVHVEDGTTYLPPITEHWSEVLAILEPTMDAIMSFQSEVDALESANAQVNALFE